MKGSRTDAVLLGVSALVPACLVAWHVGNVPDAAHDGGVARVLGLDPQPWRALHVLGGALLAAFPGGRRAARAAHGGALVTAGAGAVLYVLARRLLGACADSSRTGRLRFFVASIAALTPLVAAPWQIEGGAVGGSVAGALLVVLPVALAGEGAPWAAVALALGVAAGYEPLVGACAGAGCAALLASSPAARESPPARRLGGRESVALAGRERGSLMAVAVLVGLAPWVLAVLRVRAAGVPLGAALLDGWAGERGLSHGGSPASFLSAEMGVVLTALAVGGAVLAMLVPGARPLASSVVALV